MDRYKLTVLIYHTSVFLALFLSLLSALFVLPAFFSVFSKEVCKKGKVFFTLIALTAFLEQCLYGEAVSQGLLSYQISAGYGARMLIILCTRAFHWTLTFVTLNPHILYVEIPLVYCLATAIIETYQIAIFRMLSPMPCVTFRNLLVFYGTELLAPPNSYV